VRSSLSTSAEPDLSWSSPSRQCMSADLPEPGWTVRSAARAPVANSTSTLPRALTWSAPASSTFVTPTRRMRCDRRCSCVPSRPGEWMGCLTRRFRSFVQGPVTVNENSRAAIRSWEAFGTPPGVPGSRRMSTPGPVTERGVGWVASLAGIVADETPSFAGTFRWAARGSSATGRSARTLRPREPASASVGCRREGGRRCSASLVIDDVGFE